MRKPDEEYDELEELEKQYVEKFGDYPNMFAIACNPIEGLKKALKTGVPVGANIPKGSLT